MFLQIDSFVLSFSFPICQWHFIHTQTKKKVPEMEEQIEDAVPDAEAAALMAAALESCKTSRCKKKVGRKSSGKSGSKWAPKLPGGTGCHFGRARRAAGARAAADGRQVSLRSCER